RIAARRDPRPRGLAPPRSARTAAGARRARGRELEETRQKKLVRAGADAGAPGEPAGRPRRLRRSRLTRRPLHYGFGASAEKAGFGSSQKKGRRFFGWFPSSSSVVPL